MLRPGVELCLHWTAAKIFNRRVDGERRHLMGLRPSGKEFEIDAGAGRTAAPLGCAASRGRYARSERLSIEQSLFGARQGNVAPGCTFPPRRRVPVQRMGKQQGV